MSESFASFADLNGLAQTLVLLLSGWLIWYQVRADHRKRRVEQTLTLLRETYGDIEGATQSLNAPLGLKPGENINGDQLGAILSTPEYERRLLRVLNLHEQIAVGIVFGAYDLDAIDAADGPRIIRVLDRWKPYIDWRRENRNQTSFNQLEGLVRRLRSRRTARRWVPPRARESGAQPQAHR